ncbi:unnamed protein product, partial [Owenia fusiformis]
RIAELKRISRIEREKLNQLKINLGIAKTKAELGNVTSSSNSSTKAPTLPQFREIKDNFDPHSRRFEKYSISRGWESKYSNNNCDEKDNVIDPCSILPSDQLTQSNTERDINKQFQNECEHNSCIDLCSITPSDQSMQQKTKRDANNQFQRESEKVNVIDQSSITPSDQLVLSKTERDVNNQYNAKHNAIIKHNTSAYAQSSEVKPKTEFEKDCQQHANCSKEIYPNISTQSSIVTETNKHSHQNYGHDKSIKLNSFVEVTCNILQIEPLLVKPFTGVTKSVDLLEQNFDKSLRKIRDLPKI